MSSTISTPFVSSKNTCHQVSGSRQGLFKLLDLFGDVRASTALTALGFQRSQMRARFHRLLLVPCDWEIHRSKKSKPKPFCAFFVHLWAFSEPILLKFYGSLASLWQSLRGEFVREICGNSHETFEIVKRRLSQILLSALWSRSSLTTDGRPTTSSFIISIYTIVLQFLQSLHFGRKSPRIIHDGFPLHSCF
jgi:hypothetical protein